MESNQVVTDDIKELFRSLDRVDSVELDRFDMNFEFLTKSEAIVADDQMTVLPPAVDASVPSSPMTPREVELISTSSPDSSQSGDSQQVMGDLMWMSNIINLGGSTQGLERADTVICVQPDTASILVKPKQEVMTPDFESPPPSPCYSLPEGSGDNYGVGISDSELVSLSVRELNRRVQGHPRDIICKLKQKRRTLKNRGYAQNCRTRRMLHKDVLEQENSDLLQEVQRLKQQLARSIQERDRYKRECERLVNLGQLSPNRTSSDDVFDAL